MHYSFQQERSYQRYYEQQSQRRLDCHQPFEQFLIQLDKVYNP